MRILSQELIIFADYTNFALLASHSRLDLANLARVARHFRLDFSIFELVGRHFLFDLATFGQIATQYCSCLLKIVLLDTHFRLDLAIVTPGT